MIEQLSNQGYYCKYKQKAVVYLVRERFPELTEMAQESVQRIKSPDALSFLLEQVENAANEVEARAILRVPAA